MGGTMLKTLNVASSYTKLRVFLGLIKLCPNDNSILHRSDEQEVDHDLDIIISTTKWQCNLCNHIEEKTEFAAFWGPFG